MISSSCLKPEPRKPIVRKTSSFMEESVERNKVLNKMEEEVLIQKIKKDSINKYFNSEQGFWYYYVKKNEGEGNFPSKGDEVVFLLEIKDLRDTILYSTDELGIKNYIVDKEDLITGLQDGIKLMKEGEVITFLFPSHKAYGYTGFDKVQPNQPLICTVQLIKINFNNKENEVN